jgi:hypothetical protein
MKQIGTGMIMYATDYDDKCVPWYVTTGQPANIPLMDNWRTWVQNLQPYIKSGDPNKNALVVNPAAINIPPTGIMHSPMWTQEKWLKGAHEPDCDGVGALNPYMPIRLTHAHYGIGHGAAFGSCTVVSPYAKFAGSGGSARPLDMTAPFRIPETLIITDGFTGTVTAAGTTLLTTMGCESRYMYKGGGNGIFLDSHAKFIKGNNERYLDQDAAACWYMRHHAVDK